MSKLEVDNGKLDFRSTAQSKKYIVKMACLMANSSEASVSRQLGAVLPNLAWLLADTKIETNCMCSHVIFITSRTPS